MSLDILSLRRMIYRPLGLIGNGTSPVESTGDNDLPLDECDLYLNRSFWEIMSKYKFREKEVLGTFPTVAGQRNYTVPSPFEAIRNIAIVNPLIENTQHTPLGQILAEEYEKRYNEQTGEQDFPSHYVREGCLIKLWPTPDDVYTVTLRRWITLADISAGNGPDVPQEWHEIIGFGGLWRAYIDMGDLARAANIKTHQVSLINTTPETETKERDANTSLARVNIANTDYGRLRGVNMGGW